MPAPISAFEEERSYRLLRRGAQPERAVEGGTAVSSDRLAERGRRIVCEKCGSPITSSDRRIEVAGAFEHTFANPHGYIYRIGCFRDAPGCLSSAESTAEFSWFPGYAWALTACAMCGNHLGWQYLGDRDRFFGLVLDRLAEGERPGG